MSINIEDLTMEEYEILIRGGNSPGSGRLSINEMTMEEYDEMIRGRSGSELYRPSSTIGDRQRPSEFYADEEDFTDEDEDKEWEKLEMWLTNKIDENSKCIPFPEKKVYSEETIGMEDTEKAFIVQKEEINFRANDTTPDLPIMKPCRPRMHKWVREKDVEEQVSSPPKPIVEPYCPPIPFPNRLKTRSGNILDSSPFIITNEFVEFQEEMIEETWFDAPVFDEEEELEQSLEDEVAELNLFLTKEPDTKFLVNTEFVGDRELLEIEYLMEHDGATFLDESVLNQRIEEWAKTRTKRSNEAAENAKENLNSEPIRRMPIKGHTPYAPGNINTPYVNFGHTPYATSVPKTSFWQDVFGKEVTHLNPRCEEVFLRETREWNDARVKLRKVLVLSNEALVLDD